MATVYALVNSENGKAYVGQTWALPRRLSQHKNDHRRRITPLNASIAKHGFGAFEVLKLKDGIEDQPTLDWVEKFWINTFGSYQRGVGYNLREGGHGGGRHSEETKAKISLAKKGTRSRLGAKLSDETKAKIAASHRGLKASEETRRKLSVLKTGTKKSPETRAKMSKSRKAYLARTQDWKNRKRDAKGRFE